MAKPSVNSGGATFFGALFLALPDFFLVLVFELTPM